MAILTGDFLFSRASDIPPISGPEAVRIQARTFERLVTGQIRETVGPADGEDPLSTTTCGCSSDKTGSLIATSRAVQGHVRRLRRADHRHGHPLRERIGVAFQLADDLVDLTNDSVDSGKTPGTDLKEGVPTLASLIVLRDAAAEDARLADLLTRPLDDAEVGRRLRCCVGTTLSPVPARWHGSGPTTLASASNHCLPVLRVTRWQRSVTTWSTAPADDLPRRPECGPRRLVCDVVDRAAVGFATLLAGIGPDASTTSQRIDRTVNNVANGVVSHPGYNPSNLAARSAMTSSAPPPYRGSGRRGSARSTSPRAAHPSNNCTARSVTKAAQFTPVCLA